jgi:hypothetical protein
MLLLVQYVWVSCLFRLAHLASSCCTSPDDVHLEPFEFILCNVSDTVSFVCGLDLYIVIILFLQSSSAENMV